MSDDFGIDLDEVYRVIDAADVLVVRFQLIQDRLLVDFRTRPGTGPFVGVVPPATSVEERMRAIRQLRPEFPLPEQVMSFHWPRSTRVFVESGIWERIASRLADLGGEASVSDCRTARMALEQHERNEVVGAITGADHYQTLWERR